MKVLTFDSFVNKPVVTECVVSNLQATNHNIRSDQNYCCLDGFHFKKNPKIQKNFYLEKFIENITIQSVNMLCSFRKILRLKL